MARRMPELGRSFVQAESEIAAINMALGAAATGARVLVSSSSPGISLMAEGMSYLAGSELPIVLVNVMRGGPGLGNIAPEQSDIKLACRGLGHGNTYAIVLAPATPQEMLELTVLAFDLSFRYRNPVIVLGDGYLGQMTGKVTLPPSAVSPGLPAWAVWGDAGHRGNLNCSIFLAETDLEAHNAHLNDKYARMTRDEQRADLFQCDDADVVLVACNTPAQMAKGAVRALRALGIRAGLFRPVTLWPFPIDAFRPVAARARRIVVVEASAGQLEDELRLALSKDGTSTAAVLSSVRRMGGVLPQQREIVERVVSMEGGAA
jgi:pyruvate/2-oxoacid:ferredoxin oxidoreductase alpha subunit